MPRARVRLRVSGVAALLGVWATSSFGPALRLFAYEPLRVAIWFAGAAVVHDSVLIPLYSSAERAAQETASGVGRGPAAPRVGYVRVAAFLSLLPFLVWLPGILGLVDTFGASTGLGNSVFLPRWLLITAALSAGSAAVRTARRFARIHPRRRRRAAELE